MKTDYLFFGMTKINKALINRWLCDQSESALGWTFCFHIGSKALGSDWQEQIPITGLLLAGLRAKKVNITGVYNWNRLVGGLVLRISRTGIIKQEDFDGFPITRNQFDRNFNV